MHTMSALLLLNITHAKHHGYSNYIKISKCIKKYLTRRRHLIKNENIAIAITANTHKYECI